jgi:CheY-like chemotaxis protein
VAPKREAQIFITDDDADDRGFIINALHRNGFVGELLEFENGEHLSDYLHKYPKNLPDLILLDLNMPVKNGFDILRELKSDTTFSYIPVVIISASTKKEDEQICLRTGCEHFLSKPFDMAGYNNIAEFVDRAFFRE